MKKLAGLLMAAVVALCIGTGGAAIADDDEVVIGFAVAQSGWMSAHDGPNVTGALLAIDDINAKGGILGKQIRTVFSDTKADQTLSAQAAQDVIAQGADFVFVTCDYDMGSGAGQISNDNGIVAISCGGGVFFGVQGIGPYAYTMANSGLVDGAIQAQFAIGQGWKKGYMLLDTSIEWNKNVCDSFVYTFEKLGGTMVGADTFRNEDASLASQITRMQGLGEVDVISACTYGGAWISLLRQIRSAGTDVPIMGNAAQEGDYWVSGIPDLSNSYNVHLASIFGDDPRPHVGEFFARYEEKAGEKPVNSQSLVGYSIIQAFAIASERAGTTEGSAVVAELDKFDKEPLFVGPTTFTPDLHIDLSRSAVVVQVQNGVSSLVDVVALDEAPPVELAFKKKN